MQQLNIQLYARTDAGTFSEDVSVRQTVTLGAEPSRTELEIEAPAKKKFVELRLDPNNRPSTFALQALTVRGANGKEIWDWDRNPYSLKGLAGLQAWETEGQIVLESSIDDPFFLIELPKPQSKVTLEISVVSAILGDDSKALAQAVRSLQGSLRSALDDLSNEQEALQESLLLNQAKARSEVEAINRQFAVLAPAVREEVETARNEILAGVRDDWRSVRQQIADVADAAQRNDADREAAFVSNLEAEFTKLRTVVGRVAASQDVMNEIRHELGIRRDEDAIAELQKLKAELNDARDRIRKMESSFAWRITHPFGS
jgi:hypothetical protein